MADEFVHIVHPDSGGGSTVGGPVTREAFEGYWKGKGWSAADVTTVTGADGVARLVVADPAPVVAESAPKAAVSTAKGA